MLNIQISDTKSFDRAVRAVAKFAPPSASLPILENIHLQTIENGLSLTATDLEVAVSYALNSSVIDGDGEFLINAKTLVSLAGLAKAETDAKLMQTSSGIDLEFSDAPTFKAHFYTPIAVDEFPMLPTDSDTAQHVTLTPDAVKILKSVAKYVSKDQYRMGMDSVQFKSHNGWLYIYACDSANIASAELHATDTEIEFSVPIYCLRKAFQVASGDLAKTDWNISVANDDSKALAFIDIGKTRVSTRCGETTPQVFEFISELREKRLEHLISIKTEPLAAAMKKLTKVFEKGKNGKANLLTLQRRDGQATLTAQAFQASSQTIRYADTFKLLNEMSHTFDASENIGMGADTHIALNADLVPDMLKVLTAYKPKSVSFKWDTPEMTDAGVNGAVPVKILIGTGIGIEYISQSADGLFYQIHGENPC